MLWQHCLGSLCMLPCVRPLHVRAVLWLLLLLQRSIQQGAPVVCWFAPHLHVHCMQSFVCSASREHASNSVSIHSGSSHVCCVIFGHICALGMSNTQRCGWCWQLCCPTAGGHDLGTRLLVAQCLPRAIPQHCLSCMFCLVSPAVGTTWRCKQSA